MNKENYASVGACKRLIDAGIYLKSDTHWHNKGDDDWEIVINDYWTEGSVLPCVSMSELWRELPAETILYKGQVHTEAYRTFNAQSSKMNTNPCDALAELLIWVRKEKP
jgi:hypothetical protein